MGRVALRPRRRPNGLECRGPGTAELLSPNCTSQVLESVRQCPCPGRLSVAGQKDLASASTNLPVTSSNSGPTCDPIFSATSCAGSPCPRRMCRPCRRFASRRSAPACGPRNVAAGQHAAGGRRGWSPIGTFSGPVRALSLGLLSPSCEELVGWARPSRQHSPAIALAPSIRLTTRGGLPAGQKNLGSRRWQYKWAGKTGQDRPEVVLPCGFAAAYAARMAAAGCWRRGDIAGGRLGNARFRRGFLHAPAKPGGVPQVYSLADRVSHWAALPAGTTEMPIMPQVVSECDRGRRLHRHGPAVGGRGRPLHQAGHQQRRLRRARRGQRRAEAAVRAAPAQRRQRRRQEAEQGRIRGWIEGWRRAPPAAAGGRRPWWSSGGRQFRPEGDFRPNGCQ